MQDEVAAAVIVGRYSGDDDALALDRPDSVAELCLAKEAQRGVLLASVQGCCSE
jgi:hypothetical protein